MPDLEHMNEDELYAEALRLHDENKQYLAKMQRREELTPDEQARHEEIVRQAQRILDLQREHDVRRRSERQQQQANEPPPGEPFWFRKVGG